MRLVQRLHGPALALVVLAAVSSCGKSPSQPDTGPFRTDSYGTWIVATEPARGVAWAAATGKLVCGRVVTHVDYWYGVFEEWSLDVVDPVSGLDEASLASGLPFTFRVLPGGRYVLLGDGRYVDAAGTGEAGIVSSDYRVFSPDDSLAARTERFPKYAMFPESTFISTWRSTSPVRFLCRGIPDLFSPDGRALLVSRMTTPFAETLLTVQLATGEELPLAMPPNDGTVVHRAWDAAGLRLYVWSQSTGSFYAWDPVAAHATLLSDTHGEAFRALATNGSGRVAFASTGQYQPEHEPNPITRTFIWLSDGLGGPAVLLFQTDARLESMAMSPDGRRLALEMADRIYLRDLP